MYILCMYYDRWRRGASGDSDWGLVFLGSGLLGGLFGGSCGIAIVIAIATARLCLCLCLCWCLWVWYGVV
jgi:hypothetical protein